MTGATGNVGTSVVRALAAAPAVTGVLGIARRRPGLRIPGASWAAADIEPGGSDLAELFAGKDAVVHLAWKFQPTHDPVATWRTNVLGGIRVFEARAAAGVDALVHASSVGTYSPGPDDGRPVDESWPTHGWPGVAYTREKAYLERYLDAFQADHPEVRVVRMRPGFLFKEALHTDDAAQVCRAAVLHPVRGPFNLVADPVLDVATLARLLDARTVRVPAGAAHATLAAAWHLHMVPADPGLLDAVLRLPLLDATRARRELGWIPAHTTTDAIGAFLEGLRHGTGLDTPPLAGAASGRIVGHH